MKDFKYYTLHTCVVCCYDPSHKWENLIAILSANIFYINQSVTLTHIRHRSMERIEDWSSNFEANTFITNYLNNKAVAVYRFCVIISIYIYSSYRENHAVYVCLIDENVKWNQLNVSKNYIESGRYNLYSHTNSKILTQNSKKAKTFEMKLN